MITVRTNSDQIPQILREHLANKAMRKEEPLFVFSSDVAAQSWSEWAVRNPDESGAEAVALEDFTAWDRFKGAYLAGSVRDKVCVPALLRKLFVRNLIHEHISTPVFKKIIPAGDAETAYAFTDWLSKILPSLRLWHEKYTDFLLKNALSEETDGDEENQDYNAIYARYNAFLEENHFFEPSWLTPEFIEKKKTIVIFYPELLEDFSDYEEVFADADNVIAVELQPVTPVIESAEKTDSSTALFRPKAYKYPDSRTELRRTLLHLRALHERGVKWTDMAVSVPDLETYRPYLKRECARYCVPVNIRSGEPLTKNCAGLVFRQINDCYTGHFSYDSVRALLQNEYVPWKEDMRAVKESLVREGNRLHTICGYEEAETKDGSDKVNHHAKRIDSWVEALKGVVDDEDELKFYRTIKNEVTRICEAKTFADVRKAWLVFRERFLSEDFSDEANKILGRCVSELNDIADIEARYVGPLKLTVEKPFAFFLNELDGKTYRPQEELNGVSVFPYKLSAQAAIPYQFVIDASQGNLDIPYKKLGFLNTEKRKALLGNDIDEHTNASAAFVRLYAKHIAPRTNADNNADDIFFSYAEDSFSGFAILHNALTVADEKNPRAELDETDFYKNERHCVSMGACVRDRQQESGQVRHDATAAILSRPRTGVCVRDRSGAEAFLVRQGRTKNGAETEPRIARPEAARRETPITETQKSSFLSWAERTEGFENALPYTVSDALRGKITEKVATKRHSESLVVTQKDLANCYPCPRKWVLSSILNLREDSLDTNLMGRYDMGNVNHKVLELFMKELANNGGLLPVTNDDGVFLHEKDVREKVRAYTVSAIHDKSMDFRESPIVIRALESQTDAIAQGVMDFLHRLCAEPKKPADGKKNRNTSVKGFGGYKVLDAEVEVATKNASGTKLFGKIDLLLSDMESGDYVIIDYKNSEAALPDAGDLIKDENGLLGNFQMPMYVTLVKNEKIRDAQKETSDAAGTQRIEAAYFYAIKASKDSAKRAAIDEYKGLSTDKSAADGRNPYEYDVFCADTLPLFDRYADDFAARVQDCRFEPVNPEQKQGALVHVEPYSVCVKCDFKGICRTTFTIGERQQERGMCVTRI